jgi:inner membrane protein
MSSFIGHSLAAMTIYSLENQHQIKLARPYWLIWLIIIASLPDIDYLFTFLRPASLNGIRITHSFCFSLLAPLLNIILMLGRDRSDRFKTHSLQVIIAGLSHLVLDLAVGVTSLPLLYPFSHETFKLPFGILPSAGKIQVDNYLVYRNLLIEIGVILPIFLILYLAIARQTKNIFLSISLVFISSCFMFWAYTLPR